MNKALSSNQAGSPKRTLITGGAGFIGSHLARRLQRDGHSVVILDSLLPQVHGDAPGPDLPGCETIWADVRDEKALARAMEGVDVVHHLAAETGVGQSQYEIGRYVSTNTYGTALVLEQAVASRVRQVVIASSRAVYGEGLYRCANCQQTFVPEGRRAAEMDEGKWDIYCTRCGYAAAALPMIEDETPAPSSVYGITKLQQEQLSTVVGQTHNLPVTILRFFNVYGPGQSLRNPYVGVLGTFFRRAVSGAQAELYEDARMLRDFVFVDDVVEALRLSSGNERAYGQTLNVGTGEAVTLQEVADEMFRALGLEPKSAVSGRYRLGDVRHAFADASRLESVLDFRPRISFAQGVRAYANWALENQMEAADATADEQLARHNLLRSGKQ
jgi:dTDP-L-rhamnose 4-epimerase